MLYKLNYPYGLNFRNYIIIKYILSSVISIVIFLRTYNLFFSIIYFILVYLIPNFLIKKFQKNESIKLVKEIKNITNNLSLLLTSNVTFYDALKACKSSIEYKRFKDKFEIFVEDYSLYNFNLIQALEKFKNNFTSDEFNMFINVLKQADKEGKIIEILEVFQSTLELSYFKYVKHRERQVATYILIASVISLCNIIMILVYPMIVQIVRNVNVIFK